jgi:hypothetical protein
MRFVSCQVERLAAIRVGIKQSLCHLNGDRIAIGLEIVPPDDFLRTEEIDAVCRHDFSPSAIGD